MKWPQWCDRFSAWVRAGKRPSADRRAGCKPQLEALEAREVLSAVASGGAVAPVTNVKTEAFPPPPPTAAGLALIKGLPDARVRARALADYKRDGSITRNDLLDVFSYGTSHYQDLSAVGLGSLLTLVKDGAAVAMPDFVQVLGAKALAGISPLGGPHSALALEQNVDNFFLGRAHPDALGDPYVAVQGPLWNGVPRPQDVYQPLAGALPDNWLQTALEGVVSREPAAIMSSFIDNGDGTYTVRLYRGSAPDYVTVDRYLPSGNFTRYDTGVLWPHLLRKAYAQENPAGIAQPGPGGTYADLNFTPGSGEPNWAFTALTGQPGDNGSTYLAEDRIIRAWTQGGLVALRTSPWADPLLYPECNGDCRGSHPTPRWYALVNYVPDAAWHGRFTVTEDGQRYLEVAGSVLEANFPLYALTQPVAAPGPHDALGGLQGVAVAGFVHSAAQPQAQPSPPQNAGTASPAPAGLQADAVLLTALSAGKKQGGVTPLASSAAL